MTKFFEVFEKAIISCLATAIVAMLTLAAVSQAELDSHLLDAVQRYFWSIPFLGGFLFLRSTAGEATRLHPGCETHNGCHLGCLWQATTPILSPVEGLITLMVAPSSASHQVPLMNSLVSE
ncbi:hypothetical protein [Paraburkholderia sp. BR14374]|uniref:hypothetical protein n=1 Tax=Paraburkholderia sp. BR14374 TaxID=3237007 RepID=UPI0034CEEBE6